LLLALHRALSYSKASVACKNIGAYLVSYNTAAEQVGVTNTAYNPLLASLEACPATLRLYLGHFLNCICTI
jgi:hypothetical protein